MKIPFEDYFCGACRSGLSDQSVLFRCTVCENFGLCHNCFEQRKHISSHPMMCFVEGVEYEIDNAAHLKITCDGCGKEGLDFCGKRYACVECHNVDLCEDCASNEEVFPGSHRIEHSVRELLPPKPDQNMLEDALGFVLEEKVEARFRGGDAFYPGVIKRLGTNGCDIDYDNGDKESNVPSNLISSMAGRWDFDRGEMVEARFQGGDKYYPGVVSRVCNVRFDIDYDNGDKETDVHEDYISSLIGAFSRGDKIEALHEGGDQYMYYPGVIARSCAQGFEIHYDNGDQETEVPVELVRPRADHDDNRGEPCSVLWCCLRLRSRSTAPMERPGFRTSSLGTICSLTSCESEAFDA